MTTLSSPPAAVLMTSAPFVGSGVLLSSRWDTFSIPLCVLMLVVVFWWLPEIAAALLALRMHRHVNKIRRILEDMVKFFSGFFLQISARKNINIVKILVNRESGNSCRVLLGVCIGVPLYYICG